MDLRTWLKDHPALTIVTFGLSVVSFALSAVLAFAQFNIAITLGPQFTTTQLPRTLQVGITNSSARGVAVTGGRVLVDDRVVANVTGILLDIPDPGDPRFLDQILESAQALPVSLSAGQGIATTFLLDAPPDAPEDVRELFTALSAGVPDYSLEGRARLQVDVEPGGTEEALVAFPPRNLGWRTEFEDPGHRPGWHSRFRVDAAGHVTAVEVGNGGYEPATATLRIWRPADPAPFFESTRPLVGGFGDFVLPAMPEPQYSWTVEVDGQVVASSTLVQPCGLGITRVGAENCVGG